MRTPSASTGVTRTSRRGAVRLGEFRRPLGISQNGLALAIDVPPRRMARQVNPIVQGKRAMTADTALRLARYFSTSPGFWIGLKDDFELEEARRKLGAELDKIFGITA
jgi:addiction module HigA family antidote